VEVEALSAMRHNGSMTFEDSRRLLTRRRFQPTRVARGDGAVDGAAEVRRGPRRIVLTGGPGSGKSTAAAFLAREFVDELWVLPESATLLYRGGMPRSQSDLGVQVAQRAIYTVQRSLEDATTLQHPDRVQLCDRATIDGAAYWPDGEDAFYRANGTTRGQELARYDAVVFMHTAALLPAGYERDLEVRTEDNDEAIALDRSIFDLYREHPRVVSVASHESFLDKLIAVRNAIAELVAEPGPMQTRMSLAESVEPAPISSLMGLASVGHVLPEE
jgi:predicted ATPase